MCSRWAEAGVTEAGFGLPDRAEEVASYIGHLASKFTPW